jgi:hypothetical protein
VNAQPEAEGLETALPDPQFEITGAAHVAFAATPTMLFSATVTDTSGVDIQSISLSVQVMIEPAKRGYDPATRERLAELFGPPASWAPATSGMPWGRVAAAVPSFSGATMFGIEVPCTYDLEVASAKYFYAVADGEVPLGFHFNGNVFFYGARAQLTVVPVSWSATAHYKMPVAAWRAMIAEHYPGGGWIRVDSATLAALNERRAARGLPSFDAAVSELLTLAGEHDA